MTKFMAKGRPFHDSFNFRDLINYEYGTDLYELDDVDQLIIPDLTSKQLQAYIRYFYK